MAFTGLTIPQEIKLKMEADSKTWVHIINSIEQLQVSSEALQLWPWLQVALLAVCVLCSYCSSAARAPCTNPLMLRRT